MKWDFNSHQRAATEPLLSRPFQMGIDEPFLRAIQMARRFLQTYLATDDKSYAQKVLYPDDMVSEQMLRTWKEIIAKAVAKSSPTWTEPEMKLLIFTEAVVMEADAAIAPMSAEDVVSSGNYKLFKRKVC